MLVLRRMAAGLRPSGGSGALSAAVRRCSALVPNNPRGHPDIQFRVGEPADLPDAFALVAPQLQPLNESLAELVDHDHEMLQEASQHFFKVAGKRFRPTIALLAAAACNGEADERQRRLAQVIEMIHAASLLHDDVIDLAETRRGEQAVHKMFGNKVAVLSGDFVLARAIVMVAQLGDDRVVSLVSEIIDQMVAGELMQAKAMPHDLLRFEHYLEKTYCKTAALISLGCEGVAVLGGHTPEVAAAMRDYGRHLGIAYQVIDDLLDITGSTDALGKPALADLGLGLATAPTLFALEEFPELREAIMRSFTDDGDVALVADRVLRSDSVRRTQQLAVSHATLAAEALGALPPSPARDALLRLCSDVLNRKA